MSAPDVTELLERGAAAPSSVADVDEIRARAELRRRRRRFGVGAAVAAGVVAVVGGMLFAASLLGGPSVPFVDSAPPLRGTSTPSVQTGQGEAAVSVHVDPVRIARGEHMDTWLVNTGEVDVYYTPECSIDRWDGDRWEQIPQTLFSTPKLLEPTERSERPWQPCFQGARLQGQTGADGSSYAPASQRLSPGWYRVRWQVTALGPRLNNPRLEAATTFQITDEPTPTPSDAISLPTIPTPEGEGGDRAAAHGTVRFDQEARCFYLDQGGTRTTVAWPRGWHAKDGPPRLIDADGTTRLRVGDRVELGGGYGQTYEGHEPCPGSGEWFFAWQVNERGN